MIKADSSTQLNKGSEYIALFVSSVCLLLMVLPTKNMLRYVLLYALFMFVLMRNPLHLCRLWTLSKNSMFFCLLGLAIGVWKFSETWNYNVSVLFPFWADNIKVITVLIGLLLAFLGSFFLASLVDAYVEPLGYSSTVNPHSSTSHQVAENNVVFHVAQDHTKRNDIIICLLMVVAVITVCNMCSPLYPTNPWVSPACYHTVGKSLWSGMMPYRDLYEHKGPLVYVLHSIATLISYRSFFGMYLFLLLFAFFFFYYSRKTLRLFTNKPLEPWFPIVCVGIYALYSYNAGDSVEEMSFPFLMYSIYVALLYILRGQSFTKKTAVAVGVCVGVILWTKFVILAFYFVWYIYLDFYMIRRRRVQDFFLLLKYSLVGCLIVTFPVVFFYLVSGAFPYMMDVYFHDNIFLYINSKLGNGAFDECMPYYMHLWNNVLCSIHDNTPLYMMLFVGLAYLSTWNRQSYPFILTLVFSIVVLIFLKVVLLPYYTLMLAFFVPFAVLPFVNIPISWMKNNTFFHKCLIVLLMGIGSFLVVKGSNNIKFMFLDKNDFVQYRFANIIMRENNPTMMNYKCQDQGVFAVTGILPVNRFYCDFNIDAPGKEEDQERIVKNRLVDFLITENVNIPISCYSVIDSVKCPVYKRMYYLYKKQQ